MYTMGKLGHGGGTGSKSPMGPILMTEGHQEIHRKLIWLYKKKAKKSWHFHRPSQKSYSMGGGLKRPL
jgi:hypothetical protein